MRYLVYDVFTDVPYGGNPLAVLPDARDVPEDAFQKIAREFNLSETAFVLPPETEGSDVRIRIFTPMQEIPFAGHPLIGTAVALSQMGRGPQIVAEIGHGPMTLFAESGRAAFTTTAPFEIADRPERELVAACLDLPVAAIRRGPHAPVIASAGLPFVLVELDSIAFLDKARPVTPAFLTGQERHPSPFDFAIYAFVKDGDVVDARMFAPLDGIPEDPATGSAAAALGLWLHHQETAEQSLTIRQGVAMGRPSAIGVLADDQGATISGHAVRVMEGDLHLP